MILNPQNLYATSASAQPPDVSSTKWLTMDLDHAEFGLLEWVLKVKCVIGLQQKNGFEPKIIIPKNMATQETKPGTLVFFFCSVIYIYMYISGLFDIFGTRDLADSKLSLKPHGRRITLGNILLFAGTYYDLVRLKVDTTRLSKS